MEGLRGWMLCAVVAAAAARKCSETGEDCKETKCCNSPLMTCFRKNSFWAGCKESCKPGLDMLDPPADRTPWSCEPLGEQRHYRGKGDLPGLPSARYPEDVAPPPFALQCRRGVTKGALGVAGADVPTYVAGGGGMVRDPGLFLGHNSGYSILRACSTEYGPQSFALFRPLGGRISFSVDLSGVGCGCNVAFYLTAQPARGRDGDFSPGEKADFYCDANDVQSQWCPEVDIMEANNRVFAATLHTCDSPKRGHYAHCDRGGRGQNTRDVPGSYGLGSEYRIDTSRPFEVTMAFGSDDSATLTGVRTTLAQEGRTVELEHGNAGASYLNDLSPSLAEGMAVRISYWGKRAKTMAWLDEPPCSSRERCNGTNAGVAVISTVAVQGSLAPALEVPTRHPEEIKPYLVPTASPWSVNVPPSSLTLQPYDSPAPEFGGAGTLSFAGAPAVPIRLSRPGQPGAPAVQPGQASWGGVGPLPSTAAAAPAITKPRRSHVRPLGALVAAVALGAAVLLTLVLLPQHLRRGHGPGLRGAAQPLAGVGVPVHGFGGLHGPVGTLPSRDPSHADHTGYSYSSRF